MSFKIPFEFLKMNSYNSSHLCPSCTTKNPLSVLQHKNHYLTFPSENISVPEDSGRNTSSSKSNLFGSVKKIEWKYRRNQRDSNSVTRLKKSFQPAKEQSFVSFFSIFHFRSEFLSRLFFCNDRNWSKPRVQSSTKPSLPEKKFR